jgi:heme/copper-type cytochrome/quinol oxidase subunit 3
MEASASAPQGPYVEPEPREWQPRATWMGARLLCGVAAFFFMSFVFAYFYLRSLDVNKAWKIGAVNPSIGLGVAITVVLVLSATLLRLARTRAAASVRLAGGALALALLAVVLQVIEWTTLGFGPASGAYASVFIGWTVFYVVFALFCAYWIEVQVATAWRARREGPGHGGAQMLTAGLEACSFFWSFYVATGVVAFVILYLI